MKTRISSPRRTRQNETVATSTGIVFGTDFSENARRAQVAAVAIARRFDLPLTLLHAIELPKLDAESKEKTLGWISEGRRKDLTREANVLRDHGVKVTEKVVTGRADEALIELSRAEKPRLVIVSSLGHRGVDRWFLGSVAERTAQGTPVPTLVVRQPDPWVSWAKGRRSLKVFVCFNHTLTSEAAMRWVNELAAAGPCEITVAWVNWPAEEHQRLGTDGPFPLTENPAEVQQALERDLKRKAAELLGGHPFRVRVKATWGRVDYCLAEMAKEEGSDLIVAGSHQYRGFERLWHSSVSRGLLSNASMSVAVVPFVSGKPRQISLPPPVTRVLVATDLSELANAAIPQAYSLLHGGGTVHLLHVLHGRVQVRGLFDEQRADRRVMKDPKAAACAQELRALVPVQAEAQGIFTEVRVVKGNDVATSICQHAERLSVDIICLGSHGRSGLSGALSGSVAREVMARSRRPVLVIPQPAV